MIGKTISHYRIIEKLGEGGMGVVYKAEDTKLRRVVALKFLPPELTRDAEAKTRFVQEAQAASALDHPNICTIHEIDETKEGQTFIAMACYEGESLRARIERGPLALPEALDIAVQIAQGLAEAHGRKIVHRDIKPANLLITKDGLVKIVDFGLAKLGGRAELTRTGATPGTVSYMSPEQLRGDDVDQRSDIWALGVVLYEMIAGEAPFKGEYEQAMTYSILNDQPRPVATVRPEVPGELGSIVEKCLEKDPERRYGSASELISDIRRLEAARPGAPPRGATPRFKDLPSIAVLPFSDMSSARDQDYFCEGIAEELINGLAQIAGLRVAARTSAFQYKDKDLDVRRVGRELGVQSVLEGSVRKAGSRLRITAQLINVADGYHLWSGKYDRELEDIFTIQDEISLAIVEKLKGKLLKEEESKLVRRHTGDEEAYSLYLEGRYYWNRRHEGGVQKAIELFRQAVEKDPFYAPGYIGIADCHNTSALLGYMDPRIAFSKSQEAVTKALAADEDLAEAHASLGWIKTFHDWDWAGAEAEFVKALELNPKYANAHYFFSMYLNIMGRHDEALGEIRRALDIDPVNVIFNGIQAYTLVCSRRCDDALEQVQRTIDLDPNFTLISLFRGFAFAAKGMWQEAVESFARASQYSPGSPVPVGFMGFCLGASGRKKEALDVLDRLEQLSKERFVGAYHKAMVHLGLKAEDRAYDYLGRAFVEKESYLPVSNTLPLFDSIRSDPRFIELMRGMGLQH